MNKEFMDKIKACKSAEEMKAVLGERRQLSESEQSQAVGGAGVGSAYFGTHENIDAYCDVVEYIAEYKGMDVAVDWVLGDLQSNDVKAAMYTDGVDGLRILLHALLDKLNENPNGTSFGGYVW